MDIETVAEETLIITGDNPTGLLPSTGKIVT